jgi:hypothetical protein
MSGEDSVRDPGNAGADLASGVWDRGVLRRELTLKLGADLTPLRRRQSKVHGAGAGFRSDPKKA